MKPGAPPYRSTRDREDTEWSRSPYDSGIFLSGVACASRRQCLVVGHDSSGSGVVVALSPATGAILRGQGVQTIPGTGGVGLEGVACPLRDPLRSCRGELWKVGRRLPYR